MSDNNNAHKIDVEIENEIINNAEADKNLLSFLPGESSAAPQTEHAKDQEEKQIEDRSEEREDNNNFIQMVYHASMMNLARINTKTAPPLQKDKISGEALCKIGDVVYTITDYKDGESISVKPSTLKVLCFFLWKLTLANNRFEKDENNIKNRLEVPLEEYMYFAGKRYTKSNMNKFRENLREDFKSLRRLSLAYSGSNSKSFVITGLCGEAGIKNNVIFYEFPTSTAKQLMKCPLTQLPKAFFELNERSSTLTSLCLKLSYHYFIDTNVAIGTNDILKVENLLPYCVSLPTYEEVKNTDRHYTKRIIEPFEKAMDDLGGILGRWEYCNSKKARLSQEQLDNMDYETFKNLYVKFEFFDAPDRTDAIASNQEKRRKKEEKKSETLKKSKKKKKDNE